MKKFHISSTSFNSEKERRVQHAKNHLEKTKLYEEIKRAKSSKYDNNKKYVHRSSYKKSYKELKKRQVEIVIRKYVKGRLTQKVNK